VRESISYAFRKLLPNAVEWAASWIRRELWGLPDTRTSDVLHRFEDILDVRGLSATAGSWPFDRPDATLFDRNRLRPSRYPVDVRARPVLEEAGREMDIAVHRASDPIGSRPCTLSASPTSNKPLSGSADSTGTTRSTVPLLRWVLTSSSRSTPFAGSCLRRFLCCFRRGESPRASSVRRDAFH
jgi:hypothetical protein